MDTVIGFKGHNTPSGQIVHVITDRGEREMRPSDGERFDWGYMGDAVGHLAVAIAHEIGGSAAGSSEFIKRHFLTTFPRQESWCLDAGQVVEAIAARHRAGAA